MGFLDNISAGAGSIISSGVSGLTSAIGSISGGLFNANQAKINRKFQERMYEKQKQDSIDFWNMQNEYNLPSAQYQRLMEGLKANGLNPYLALDGVGGVQSVAQSAPALPNAPKGDSASSAFNTRIDLANLGLVQAQAENLRADSELKKASAVEAQERTFGQNIQNEINWRTRDAQVAMKNKDVEMANQTIEWIATQDFALTQMTAANLDNIASMIEYRKKYYQMDFAKVENQIWYNIESIALGRAHVNNEIKELAIKLYDAKTRREQVLGELKVFDAQVKEINSRVDLNDAQKADAYLKAYNQFLKNGLLENVGTENLGGAAGLMLLLTGTVTGRIGSENSGLF